MEREGFDAVVRPDTEAPRLPEDLTDLDDRQLIKLFQEFTEWANYSASRLSIAEVDETDAKNGQTTAEALAMARHDWAKGVSVTEQKSIIQADAEVQAAQEKLASAYSYRKLVKSIFENFERCATLISRELTRRTNFEPMQRRSHRGNP